MIDHPSKPKSGEGVWLWLFKIIAGLMIVIILAVHLLVNHFAAETGLLTWADVVRYYQNPLIPAMEIVFLFFVVSHALLGLRSIILDLNPSPRTLRLVNWLFTLGGAAAIVYGVWLVFAVVAQGA